MGLLISWAPISQSWLSSLVLALLGLLFLSVCVGGGGGDGRRGKGFKASYPSNGWTISSSLGHILFVYIEGNSSHRLATTTASWTISDTNVTDCLLKLKLRRESCFSFVCRATRATPYPASSSQKCSVWNNGQGMAKNMRHRSAFPIRL